MTKEALSFSDKIIMTNDNPRNEDPNKIMDDMMIGLKSDALKKIKLLEARGIESAKDKAVMICASQGIY